MPRNDEPMGLDEDEEDDRPRRRPRGDRDEPGEGSGYSALKWICLVVAGLLAALAFGQNAILSAAFSGLACFFAICSRIMQAEEHRLRK